MSATPPPGPAGDDARRRGVMGHEPAGARLQRQVVRAAVLVAHGHALGDRTPGKGQGDAGPAPRGERAQGETAGSAGSDGEVRRGAGGGVGALERGAEEGAAGGLREGAEGRGTRTGRKGYS